MKPLKKAFLNDEGKQHWGAVFPSGDVPVKSPFPIEAELEGLGPERVFIVDWKGLSYAEQDAVLEKLRKKSGASKEDIRKEIERVGFPLRERYVRSVGIDGRLF
jgi:hypothetical protein